VFLLLMQFVNVHIFSETSLNINNCKRLNV
jgi:hypothetical protein